MFSFIITHRNANVEREKNLYSILKWIGALECKKEIILVEQDSTQMINDISNEVKYIFAYNSGIFSKSWGMNIGIRNSSSGILVFQDSDCFFSLENMNTFLSEFANKNYEWGAPNTHTYIRLNENESNNARNNILTFSRERECPLKGTVITGGIFAAKRKALDDIKWWDEDFRGWGGEDSAISSKLGKLNKKLLRQTNNGYHLWHPNGGKYVMTKDKNAKLWRERYCGSKGQSTFKGYIRNVNLDSLGNIHKYENE